MSQALPPASAVKRPLLQEVFLSYLAVWVGESSRGGVGVVTGGALVFEDQRWRDLVGDEPWDTRQASRIDAILQSHLGQLPKRSFEFHPCDLPALIEDTKALLQNKLAAAKVAVVTDLNPAVPLVEASRGHLQQVWLNVMMNAIEAMPQGGHLTVRVNSVTLRGEPGVMIAFEDTGLGIAPEDLAHIHEPFFTSEKAKGVGLGLTISRDLIDRHGGQFTIKNPPGRGTIVEIWLPVRQKG